MSADRPQAADEDARRNAEPPPGPADHGREGGMATREVAPELVERSSERSD
jgi:hypothetical protein